ncbi:ABC transporter permease [Paenibacillus sp. GYB003]|uniref:ABC transporter permease n=1 Tax=Paenibacillus sp. GYB003 TaxID=2994392 RepID=UPI002F960E7F
MIDANRLFARRLRSEWRFQYRVWKMAVDWTVALYIVIPAVAVAVYHYVSWWRDMPAWGAAVPVEAWLGALYVLSGFGALRLFVEEADQLFLIRNEAWMSRLLRLGTAYSLTVRALSAALAAGLAAPFLVRAHGCDGPQLAVAAALAMAAGTHRLLADRIVALRLPRLAGSLANGAAFVVLGALFVVAARPAAGPLWGIALTALLVGSTVVLARVRLRMTGTFYRDAAYEAEQRMKFAALLLAQVVPKPAKLRKRAKPLVFRRSQRLFRRRTPDRVLAETIVKSFFRSGTQMKMYAQLTTAFGFGLLLMPVAAKWLFWSGVSLLLAYWVRMYGKEVTASSFVKLFPWRDEDRRTAIGRATPWIFVPAYVTAGFALGWTAYGLWAGLLLIPAGWALGYLTGKLMNGW